MRCVEGRVRAVTARKSEYVLCNVSVPTCCLEADGKESDGRESDGKEFESTAAAGPPGDAGSGGAVRSTARTFLT